MSSTFMTRRIKELESMRLPKSLHGLIHFIGIDRREFTDYREWLQFCELYKAMVALQGSDGFEVIAARVIYFVEESRPKPAKPAPSPTQARTPKKKRRMNSKERRHLSEEELHLLSLDAMSKAERFLAKELRRAKPIPSKMIEDWNASPKIGLGIESTLVPPPKTRRDQVKLDAHTISATHQNTTSHILYAAGWTLAQDED